MSPHGSSTYTGRIVVRLSPRVVSRIAHRAQDPALPDWASLDQLADGFELQGLKAILTKYPPFPSYPVVRRTRVAKILKREASHDDEFQPIHSLTAYFVADPRVWGNAAQSARFLADLKATTPEIELVYRELTVRTANGWAVDPGDDFVTDQGYLDAAPKGIGANTLEVWGSFDGAGVGFVDLEAGWNLAHVDLPRAASRPQPMIHVNDPTEVDHGTAVLGIVLAKNDGDGITGIAPGADFRGVASYVVDLGMSDPAVAEAIEAAMDVLNPGDVLLLEVHTGNGYPIETDEAVFTAIRDAVGNGIIVIEPAGNGTDVVGRDLDKPITQGADNPPLHLNRKSTKFKDSGAVMVSACRANLASQGGHRRMGFAGYGTRIDCHAWGQNVVTAGGGDFGPIAGPSRSYTESFDGTSAAAAIIAGAAILVQQIASAPGARGRLKPKQMRAILSDPATGTLATSGSKKIGVMPNLKEIAKKLGSA
jgi:hypothetical protein